MTGEDRPSRRRDLWDDDGSPSTPDRSDPTASERSETAAGTTGAATSRRSLHAARRRRRPWWLVLLAILLVALLCAGGAWALIGGGEEKAACGGAPLRVAATPEIAEPLEEALSKVKEECTSFEVLSVGSATAVQNINEGKAPDVWVPDSSTWVDTIDEDAAPGQWLEGQSIATSPIVLAVGSELKGAPTKAASWTSVINSESSLQMANPDVDTASRLAFHASRVDQPGRIGLTTGKRLIFLSRFAAPSVNKLFEDYAKEPKNTDKTHSFPASEQEIAAFNEEHDDLPPLRAVAPEDGTLSLDYPWITNPELKGDVLKAADKARAQLGTLEVRDSLTEAGFRDAQGQGGPTIAGAKAPEVTELEAPGRRERVGLVEQWDIMRTDMRMLAVIDASGSMGWDSSTPGMSRWEVTQGAMRMGIDLLPAGSQVGAWYFSSDLKGKRDYQPLAPVRGLESTKDGKTHRDVLRKVIDDSEKYIGGDTALYDTIWAAHQSMVEDYDPEYVNSIVVFTDGVNDDPNGGLSLKQLLARLNKAYDPQRPVRVIAIGMGEADPTALRQIADETGGTSYIAETPQDIERVFVEALLARSH